MSIRAIIEQKGFAHLTDLPCYKLCCGEATAVISSYGAHLLSYRPAAELEVLYLSPEAQWQNNSPIRGGVPVCWPWFGPVSEQFQAQAQSLPNHGLVRTALWQLIRQSVTEQAVSIEFGIKINTALYANVPGLLTLTLELTESALTLTLRSDQGMQQAALHSYFAVDSLPTVKVSPLLGAYVDKVRSGQRFEQTEAELKFSAEVDRVYPDTADELILNQGSVLHPALQIAQQGHDASVLWNPGKEKAAALKDLPDEGYLNFVCVETARLDLANTSALHLVQKISYSGQLE